MLSAESELPADGLERDSSDAVETLTTDPFDEIDFGFLFFDDYLDPGYRSPASESVEKPSFETFLSQPLTLPDYLRSQLSVVLLDDETRDAAETIIGNLDENGYLTGPLDEMANQGDHTRAIMEAALKAVQSLDPAGVGARDLKECMGRSAGECEWQQGRRGMADRLKLPCGCSKCGSSRNWQSCWAGRRNTSTSRSRGSAPESAALGIRYSGPGSAVGRARRLLHPRW